LKILVINTGGTISGVGQPLAPMAMLRFAQAVQRHLDPVLRQGSTDLELQIEVDTELHFPLSDSGLLDSTHLQPADWCRIAAHLLARWAEHDAFVLLHGTDSLAYTAAALPFLLSMFDAHGLPQAAISKPVVITGSQLPLFFEDPQSGALSLKNNTDALQNLCGAVAVAQTGIAEVCVFFGGLLMRGSRVSKTDANQFAAFSSPNFPPLGQLGLRLSLQTELLQPPPLAWQVSLDNPAVRGRVQQQLAAITAVIHQFPVLQLNAFPAGFVAAQGGSPASSVVAGWIDAALALGARGLVLLSYGAGNFSSGDINHAEAGAIRAALWRARQQGVVVVDNSQVLRATVDNAAYAAGAWLPQVGALNPADMTPVASLAKLTVLLACASHQGFSLAQVKTLLQTNLLGEMASVNRLHSGHGARLLPGQSLRSLDGVLELRNDPRRGLLLQNLQSERILWTAPLQPDAHALPGILHLQEDGRLVFRGRHQQALWATGSAEGPAVLSLEGSASTQDQRLVLRHSLGGEVGVCLYPSDPADVRP